jgi:hypothetical protein
MFFQRTEADKKSLALESTIGNLFECRRYSDIMDTDFSFSVGRPKSRFMCMSNALSVMPSSGWSRYCWLSHTAFSASNSKKFENSFNKTN